MVLAAILAIAWWPIAIIWSLNTLFGAGIPVTLQTWLSVVILLAALRLAPASSKKD